MNCEFIFTFPISDERRNNKFVRVIAPDEIAARLRMIDAYGRRGWAFCYENENEAGVAKYGLTEIAFGS